MTPSLNDLQPDCYLILGEVSKVSVNMTQQDTVSVNMTQQDTAEKQWQISCSTNSGCQQAFVDFYAVINKTRVCCCTFMAS